MAKAKELTAAVPNVHQNKVLFFDPHSADPNRCLVTITEEWSPIVPNFIIRAKYDK